MDTQKAQFLKDLEDVEYQGEEDEVWAKMGDNINKTIKGITM